jgi:hypothetical protein
MRSEGHRIVNRSVSVGIGILEGIVGNGEVLVDGEFLLHHASDLLQVLREIQDHPDTGEVVHFVDGIPKRRRRIRDALHEPLDALGSALQMKQFNSHLFQEILYKMLQSLGKTLVEAVLSNIEIFPFLDASDIHARITTRDRVWPSIPP